MSSHSERAPAVIGFGRLTGVNRLATLLRGRGSTLGRGNGLAVHGLLSLSLLAGWLLLYGIVLSGLQEHRSQHRLYNTFREELADPSKGGPLGGAIPVGSPVAVLNSATAGFDNLVVVEGSASGALRDGPGHVRNTPLPGQPGVAILLGRSAAFGAPFQHISRLHRGDLLTVTTGQGVFRYQVDGVRRAGAPEPDPSGARLSLVTAESTGWRSGWAPDHALYLDATLQGPVAVTPAGRSNSISPAEQVMHGDSGAALPLVLWLEGLGLASAALVWGRSRWSRWQTWVAGVPLVVAALWGVSQTAVQLLPNLL